MGHVNVGIRRLPALGGERIVNIPAGAVVRSVTSDGGVPVLVLQGEDFATAVMNKERYFVFTLQAGVILNIPDLAEYVGTCSSSVESWIIFRDASGVEVASKTV